MYIDSPCIRQCTPTHTGEVCQGCGRTEGEVENWLDMTESEQLSVIERLDHEKSIPDDSNS